VARISSTYLPIKAAISFSMDAFDQAPLILPKMQDQILLTLCWRSVDAHFRMWLGAWVSVFCTSRRLIRRKWTVTYQCQYFTISSSLSECDNKCEPRNAEPEIGPDGYSQTRRNPRVDGYRSGFGPPRVRGSGFWPGLERNWPVFAVQTRTAGGLPRPVANTTLGKKWLRQYCCYVQNMILNGLSMTCGLASWTIHALCVVLAMVRGWNWPEAPGPGQEPPSTLSRSVLAGLLPGPDIQPRFFGLVEPGLRFHIPVPATCTTTKYLSSDRITIRSVCRLCSFSRSFISRCQICDWTNIHRIAVK